MHDFQILAKFSESYYQHPLLE